MNPKTSIIVTAYNEAERLGATLDALARAFPDALVWVADDGSTDATQQVARGRGARVVRSDRMIGKGGAATLAAQDLLRHVSGEESVVLLCDGDLGESATRLTGLVEAVQSTQGDLAVAVFARRVGGGVGLAVGFARWAIQRRCGLTTKAPISGQRALRVDALEDILPFARGFGMEIGMTIDAVRAGHRLVEVELALAHRATGRTFGGFVHRARQLRDFVRVYLKR
jgi:glycosyltransferase involved in cell wall biosynthesis